MVPTARSTLAGSFSEHASSNTGIAYCAQGFGPTDPWGLLFLAGPQKSMGMDSGWFITLEHAFRELGGATSSTPGVLKLPNPALQTDGHR